MIMLQTSKIGKNLELQLNAPHNLILPRTGIIFEKINLDSDLITGTLGWESRNGIYLQIQIGNLDPEEITILGDSKLQLFSLLETTLRRQNIQRIDHFAKHTAYIFTELRDEDRDTELTFEFTVRIL